MRLRWRRVLGGLALVAAALVIGFGVAVWVILDRTLAPMEGNITIVRSAGNVADIGSESAAREVGSGGTVGDAGSGNVRDVGLGGNVRDGGLDATVEITFDSMGIAQVWAETEHDAMFGLGWLHAADRMFQLDFARRAAQGRLSELLGESTVEFDIARRRDGHSRIAQAALSQLSSKNRELLQAYADGINEYSRTGGSRPLEYILLQASFEEWRVYDCLTVLSFMTWYSDALQNRDRFYATLVREGYEETVRELPLGYPEWAPTTVRTKEVAGWERVDSGRRWFADAVAQEVVAAGVEAFTAARSSNAWAVAPERSESGSAIFCSDPHLEITRLPQFWYAVGVHAKEPGLDAVGMTIPGLPFVVMGHNGEAAWAFTAAGVDVVDYYIERVNPEDRSQYLERIDQSRGRDSLVWTEIGVIHDTVRIAGRDTGEPFTVQLTRHGPVVPEWSAVDTLYVRRWAGADADLNAAVTAGRGLMRSRDFTGFREGVTRMGALNANWMYADRGGTIGYQLGSPVPRRNGASPYLPLAGWRQGNDWDGYLSMDEAPWAENPAEGWLASCNNKPGGGSEVPGTYAVDRIVRIRELLEAKVRFSTADMRGFQLDRVDAYRMRWKGLVDSVGGSVADTTGGVEAVARWDGRADTGSAAVGLMVVFLDRLKGEVFGDELGVQGEGLGTATLDQVFFGPDSGWIDDVRTPATEGRYEIARRALAEAVEIVQGRTWGEMQTLRMAHPMASAPVIGSLIDLSFGAWDWGGTSGTLNSSFAEEVGAGEYRSIVGPSWRFIVDFADVDGAVMVLPAGNSGNPLSSHFFDFNQMWREGEYWNVPISRERVYAGAVSVLRLMPEGDSVAAE